MREHPPTAVRRTRGWQEETRSSSATRTPWRRTSSGAVSSEEMEAAASDKPGLIHLVPGHRDLLMHANDDAKYIQQSSGQLSSSSVPKTWVGLRGYYSRSHKHKLVTRVLVFFGHEGQPTTWVLEGLTHVRANIASKGEYAVENVYVFGFLLHLVSFFLGFTR